MISLHFFPIFELEGTTKHLLTGAARNSDVPLGFPWGTLRASGKQNSLFPMGPVIKCLLAHIEQHVTFIASERDILLTHQVA